MMRRNDDQDEDEAFMLEGIFVDRGNIRLRSLLPSDVDAVKELCRDWFPIEYPEQWFQDITGSGKFFSAAAVDEDEESTIIGLIIAETKQQSRCNQEDRGLVSSFCYYDPLVTYILSLGVVSRRRREGIASLLLSHLIQHLTSYTEASGRNASRAIFLHVLSTNQGAIDFYRRQGFQIHRQLPLYYLIDGNCHDGCSFVKYINGGPPWTPGSLVSSLISCCRCSCLNLLKCPFFLLSFLSSYKSFLRRMFRSFCQKVLSLKSNLQPISSVMTSRFSSQQQSSNTAKYNQFVNQV